LSGEMDDWSVDAAFGESAQIRRVGDVKLMKVEV
jgi:hypothetical protein